MNVVEARETLRKRDIELCERVIKMADKNSAIFERAAVVRFLKSYQCIYSDGTYDLDDERLVHELAEAVAIGSHYPR